MRLRAINGMSKNWERDIKSMLLKYLEYVDWTLDEKKTIRYLTRLQKQYSICAFRKKCFQIRRFLNYLNVEWADTIKPPKEPGRNPKHITEKNITTTLHLLKQRKRKLQLHTLIHLGIDTGMRATELYQLRPENIDLDNRTI